MPEKITFHPLFAGELDEARVINEHFIEMWLCLCKITGLLVNNVSFKRLIHLIRAVCWYLICQDRQKQMKQSYN